jgi:Fic family protein
VLYRYDKLSGDERRALDRITRMREQLRFAVAQNPRRWSGLLARMTRARALRASNSIEGIHVSAEDAIAAIDNEDPVEADKATWQAVIGYRNAMDYILQRSRDPRFEFSLDVLLAIHFMIVQADLNANPGMLRPGWVGVRDTRNGEVVHEGVDRALLEPLLGELIAEMNGKREDPGAVLVQAAMAHLNLTLLHPFSDGNGRAARCLQTAVLARDGIVAPIFSSIEEYIGRHQQDYYDVLAAAGGGGWHPARDCRPWVRFCIAGHYRQAQTLIRRQQEMERIYEDLAQEIRKRGLPERMVLALLEAAAPLRVRNASYRVNADISNNLASRDLKTLTDAGLLEAAGERRGRHYVASAAVMAIRNKHRLPRHEDDPFAADGA